MNLNNYRILIVIGKKLTVDLLPGFLTDSISTLICGPDLSADKTLCSILNCNPCLVNIF